MLSALAASVKGRSRGMRAVLGRLKKVCLKVVDIDAGLMLARRTTEDDRIALELKDCKLVQMTNYPNGCTLGEVTVLKRLQEGHLLFGLIREESLVAWGWVSGAGRRVSVLLDISFRVPPKAIYIWDCQTVPGERNKGFFQLLMRQLFYEVVGSDVAYIAVDIKNKASRRALEKVGYQTLFSYFVMKGFCKPLVRLAVRRRRVVNAQAAFDEVVNVEI